jgi:hypothetical protein
MTRGPATVQDNTQAQTVGLNCGVSSAAHAGWQSACESIRACCRDPADTAKGQAPSLLTRPLLYAETPGKAHAASPGWLSDSYSRLILQNKLLCCTVSLSLPVGWQRQQQGRGSSKRCLVRHLLSLRVGCPQLIWQGVRNIRIDKQAAPAGVTTLQQTPADGAGAAAGD